MPRLHALFPALLLIASVALADAELVKQIRTSSATGSSFALAPQRFGDGTIFRAWDFEGGTRLWKTDGTAAGTLPLLDLNPGLDNSFFAFASIDGTIWLGTNDGSHGAELWMSDGTAAGTRMVKDIVPGAAGSGPRSFTRSGPYVYFLADDGKHGLELWRTDGTDAGTRMVRDIGTSTNVAGPTIIGPVGAGLLFIANDGTRGWELWITDGTEEGTDVVEEIVPGAGSIAFDARHVVNMGTHVYLALDDHVHGREVWKSDGTAAGTYLVKDIISGALSGPQAIPDAYAAAGSRVLILESFGGRLWSSDGTSAGTVSIATAVSSVYTWGSKAVFFREGALWQTDGTAAGTRSIASAPVASALHVVGSRIFFFAGRTLWVSDGTEAGTKAVRDVPLPVESRAFAFTPAYMGSAGDVFLFQGLDPATGHEMWRSDGTAAGTSILRDIYDRPSGGLQFQVSNARESLGNIACFTVDDGSNVSLWKTDGTTAGTVPVMDALRPTVKLFRAGNALYFSHPNNGLKPIRYDGTRVSYPDNVLSYWSVDDYTTPYHDLGGVTYFAADDGSGFELWRWDGSAVSPATRVADIRPGRDSSAPASIVAMGGRLYFSADDGTIGRELWTSDGTAAGTKLLKDVDPSGASNPSHLTVIGSAIYFFAGDGTHGRELWRTDGTPEGTRLVADSIAGPEGLEETDAIAVGSTLFFTTANQLWKSDASGIAIVREFANGFTAATESPALPPLYAINGRLVFFADDGVSGREPWVSDGTAGGTFLLRDIHPGPSSSAAWSAAPIGEMLFFTAHDPDHGTELWRTDGTIRGTELAADVAPGPASSIPILIPALTRDMLFLASTPSRGYQLHRYVASSARPKRRAL